MFRGVLILSGDGEVFGGEAFFDLVYGLGEGVAKSVCLCEF